MGYALRRYAIASLGTSLALRRIGARLSSRARAVGVVDVHHRISSSDFLIGDNNVVFNESREVDLELRNLEGTQGARS